MKILAILTLSLFITSESYAQDKLMGILPLKDSKVTYSDVVHVDSVSRNELFKRAEHWLVDSYKSSTNVIQLKDKENGEIIGKGFFEEDWRVGLLGHLDVMVFQTIKIQMKEGRYKFEITDFRLKYLYPFNGAEQLTQYDKALEQWEEDEKLFSNIDAKVKALIESLKRTMKTSTNDNW